MKTVRQCPACLNEFSCEPEPGTSACWCRRYPAILPAVTGQGCYCPDCLAIRVSESISKQLSGLPLEAAVEFASRYRTDDALVEHIDYTLESGNLVFSRWYHLKRGSCCSSGCRHCPYRHDSQSS